MKKFFAIALSALILASSAALAGCGSSEQSKTENTTAAQTQDGTTAAGEETTAQGTTKAQETTKAAEKKDKKNKKSKTSATSASSRSNQASKSANTQSSKETAKTGTFEASDLIAKVGGKSIALNENADNAVAKLGTPNNVYSEASCRGEGEDKTYEYNGFSVYAVPFDGVHKVCGVTITSGSTPKGVSIGDSESKVTQVYGNNFKKKGKNLQYAIGDKSLLFFIKDGKVVEIDYNYDVL